VPPRDQPSPDEIKDFQTAKPECAIFQDGTGGKRDWIKYRKCRLAEAETNNNAIAEIYANGWGVKRNPMLALALVCHGSTVPAELFGVVDALYSSRKETRLPSAFRFCDYVTSGMNGGQCALDVAKTIERKRDKEFVRLSMRWTVAQRAAFATLKAAAGSYIQERPSELDLSGSMRSAMTLDEQTAQWAAFQTLVTNAERGRVPRGVTFSKADADLNTLYLKLLSQYPAEDRNSGGVTAEGIKATQRKWLVYRDAWVDFARLRYPKTKAEFWKAKLTQERFALLKQLLPEAQESP
jgi:uncharacterized protein YecT (DUF1311 family)